MINRRKLKKHYGSISTFSLFFILGGVAFYLFNSYFLKPKNNPQAVKIAPELVARVEPIINQEIILETKNANSLGLTFAVEQALEGTKGTYAVIVKHLETGELYQQNEHYVFEPASLYKLWVMTVVYDQLEKGILRKDQILTKEVKELNRKFAIPEDLAEKTEGIISMSVADALQKMITISDNYSALVLIDAVGSANLKEFLITEKMAKTKLGNGTVPPETTAWDVALLLEKLYHKKIGNEQTNDEMMKLLKGQILNDLLPKYLPPKVLVAHKTGALGEFIHDAGIVYTDFGDYLIVVLSQASPRKQAEERVALVSKGVYTYFQAEHEKRSKANNQASKSGELQEN